MSKISYGKDDYMYDEAIPLVPKVTDNIMPTPFRSKVSVICVLFCELCERLTYYSIVANLLLYLTNVLEFDTATGLSITLGFTGTVYFTPIFGGWLGDAVLGRYNTIYMFSLVYFIGCALLPTVAYDNFGGNKDAARGYYLTALVFIALGTGGIKANVSTFGAQQVADLGEKYIQRFFTWFYWFVNIGSAIAYGGVTYLQQEISFFYGYLVPALTITIAILLLQCPRTFYIHERHTGRSGITDVFRVVFDAAKSKSQSIYSLDSFLDYATLTNGGSFSHRTVHEVKTVLLLLPLLVTLILFWCIYNQMQSTFLLQAERMDLTVGPVVIPAAMLSLFNALAIVIFTPFLDFIVFPLIRRCSNKPTVSLLGRIGVGLVLSVLSVVMAGGLEIIRKEDMRLNGGFEQKVANKVFNSSSVSILWQVPQFMCMGIAEIFTSATSQELIFSDSPQELKSFSMGLLLSMNGLGSYLGSALVSIVNAASAPNQWIPEDINNGNLEGFCFLLGGLGLLSFFLYIPVALWYSKAHKRLLAEKRKPDGNVVIYKSPREYDDHITDTAQSSCDSVVLITTGEFGRSRPRL